MTVAVKMCGLNTAESVDAAVQAGAGLVGFVFFKRTPRYVTPEQAGALAQRVPKGVLKVGLVVDFDDAALEEIVRHVPLDLLQLHGSETPERVAEIKKRFKVPVMKAIAIAGPDDIARARTYEKVADRLMFDARPPKDATRPGGNAQPFDWSLLKDRRWLVPWVLAGGLTAENVANAVRISGAETVDVSSGIEEAPGRKSLAKMQAFLKAAKAA